MDQLTEGLIGQATDLWRKWRRPKRAETTPTLEPTANLREVKYGSFTLASPNHSSEDVYGNSQIDGANGEAAGLRFFVIDGSGGSLEGAQLTPDQKSRQIRAKAVLIEKGIRARGKLEAGLALDEVNTIALRDSNRAFAAAVVVDILPEKVQIARRGDPTVTRFNGDLYPTRRGDGWPVAHRGGSSFFQLIDVPQNVAHALKAAGQEKTKTRLMDEEPSSSQIFSGVGTSGPTSMLEVERSEREEWLLVASDGAQGGSRLLDPDDPYSRKVKGVMLALKNGTISETEAARQITLHAREIPGEDDDITVQIIRIPPKISEPIKPPQQDPQAILAEHERGARKRGTPALYDRAHGKSPNNLV